MQKVIYAAEMREIDRLTTERFSIPSILLMEAAAASAAKAIAATLNRDAQGLKVLILCGGGNNGGDGAALARTLYTRGATIDLALLGSVDRTRGDARTNFESVRRLDITSNDEPGKGHRPIPGQPGVIGAVKFRELSSTQDFEDALSQRALEDYDVIVDALFGTGLTRPLAGLEEHVVSALRSLSTSSRGDHPGKPLIVSLDIPSGLDADSAFCIGAAVKADLTVTFTAPKPANVLPPASEFSGQLVITDIGSPVSLIEDAKSRLFVSGVEDARKWLIRTRYAFDSYKNSHGHLLVIAGSRDLTGAPVLCAEAAMRAGAGLVTVATPKSAHLSVSSRVMPEVMVAGLPETERGSVSSGAMERVARLAEKASVIAIGPGLTSEDEETRRLVRNVVDERRVPVVLDADALNSLSPWPAELRGTESYPLVLTPHAGEMLRLLGTEDRDALKERVDIARNFAVNHSLILVLKGSRTLIASPDGRVFINTSGNAGLGTAGSGDTLTGLIAGFLAQEFGSFQGKTDALSACLAAVYVGGLAGDIAASELGMRGMVASDVRERFATAMCSIDAEGERP